MGMGQNNTETRGYISMPRAEFETTIPLIKRSKTICALDSMAAEIGLKTLLCYDYNNKASDCVSLQGHV
jgi:hypothetical protein